MSGTVCSYKGCHKSYSTDKDTAFFKFPDDPKRRKKWMTICGNPELLTLSDRQLRLKRVCADHFPASAFMSAETRNQLTENSVPFSPKEQEAAQKVIEEAQAAKRGRRSAKFSLTLVKKEKEEEEAANESENGEIDESKSPPPILKKQRNDDGETDGKYNKQGRPPRLVAVNHNDVETKKPGLRPKHKEIAAKMKDMSTKLQAKADSRLKPKDLNKSEEKFKSKLVRRKSSSGRRMADLSVIDEVVNELKLAANEFDNEKPKKRSYSHSDEKILSKRMRAAAGDDENSDEFDDDSEDDDLPERANREFERFQQGLRNVITLPDEWGMGGVIWDPLNKMKVIAISETDVQMNGQIRLKRAVQIFEDNTVKVAIDGVDMTLNFGIQSITNEEDVGEIVQTVAACRICIGVQNFLPDDTTYYAYAKKRGCTYYSDACPIILGDNVKGTVCNSCSSLEKNVVARREQEKEEIENRKARPIPKDLRNDFGKSIYGLLREILDDASALKSDSKQDRDAVLSKYSTELSVMNGEIHKPEKLPHINVSVDEVSASFQDIVSRLGFTAPAGKGQKPGVNSKPGEGSSSSPKPNPNTLKLANKPMMMRPENITKQYTAKRPQIPASHAHRITTNTNSASFSLSEGQTYEIVGEVGGNNIIEMVDANKGTNLKNESIEIIEVDDETMAKLTAQNAGFFQTTPGSSIQVASLDSNDPNINQILSSINSSHKA